MGRISRRAGLGVYLPGFFVPASFLGLRFSLVDLCSLAMGLSFARVFTHADASGARDVQEIASVRGVAQAVSGDGVHDKMTGVTPPSHRLSDN